MRTTISSSWFDLDLFVEAVIVKHKIIDPDKVQSIGLQSTARSSVHIRNKNVRRLRVFGHCEKVLCTVCTEYSRRMVDSMSFRNHATEYHQTIPAFLGLRMQPQQGSLDLYSVSPRKSQICCYYCCISAFHFRRFSRLRIVLNGQISDRSTTVSLPVPQPLSLRDCHTFREGREVPFFFKFVTKIISPGRLRLWSSLIRSRSQSICYL